MVIGLKAFDELRSNLRRARRKLAFFAAEAERMREGWGDTYRAQSADETRRVLAFEEALRVRARKAWDERKHPRRRGKFAPKNKAMTRVGALRKEHGWIEERVRWIFSDRRWHNVPELMETLKQPKGGLIGGVVEQLKKEGLLETREHPFGSGLRYFFSYRVKPGRIGEKARDPMSSLHESLDLNLRRLVQYYFQERITAKQFEDTFLQKLRDHYEWAWRYGATSVGEENPAHDALAVDQLVADQRVYLRGFAKSLIDGASPRAALRRAQMYSDNLESVYGLARLTRMEGHFLTWKYSPEAQHCSGCLRRHNVTKTAEYWIRQGIPRHANTPCGPGCKCRLINARTGQDWLAPPQSYPIGGRNM